MKKAPSWGFFSILSEYNLILSDFDISIGFLTVL